MRDFFLMTIFFYQVCNVKASDGCRDLVFLDCIKNKTLVDHAIHTSNVLSPGLEQCQHECFMNDACVSYNLGPTRGMSRTCELSDTDHVGFPDQLVVKEGAEYCPIRNPCTSSPCAAIEICKPDFTWDSFTCIHKMIACRQLTKCPIYQNCVVRAETFAVECLASFSPNCTSSLGMKDKRIPDSAITASSVRDGGLLKADYGAHLARLHNTEVGLLGTVGYRSSGWSSETSVSSGEWLQVELGNVFYITKVATQGSDSTWVKKYTLQYIFDGSTWADYLDKHTGLAKEFQGNTDEDTVVEQVLGPEPIKARLIRFVILEWEGSRMSMRLELYGCKS